MMVGQEMHVRWRHHQAGLLAYLRQMLASEVFVDVTLCCQNKKLKAHRVLLSACSPYLQELLTAHPASDHVTIILDDIQYEDMRALLDFVYTGGVTVPEERLPGLLEAARSLQITVLTNKQLHQQLPAKPPPPLIKMHQELLRQNGYKTEHNGTDYKVKSEQKPFREDFGSENSFNSLGSPVDYKPFIHSPSHLSPIPRPENCLNSLKFDAHSSGSLSPDTMDFPWVRPLPSLMPISASTSLQQRRLGVQQMKPPRKSLGGILTPSPWSQNGRPQAGAPRVLRSPSRGLERSGHGEEVEHVDGARLNSSPTYYHAESNGVLPGSPRLQDTSSRSDGDSSSEPPRERENDENHPVKERKLQEFYRDPGGVKDATEIPFKPPLLLDRLQRYSERPFFPDHLSRILSPSDINPLHGLKTLAGLLDDSNSSSSSIQRRKSLSCSDLTEDGGRNDSNNNEGPENDGAGVRCDECGKVFDGEQQLLQHRQAQQCLSCEVCGKTFTQRSLWSAHQKLHEDSRQEHACTHCSKTFVTRASLKVHLRTHTGEKPFHCLECGKQFSQLRNYKYHRSVHEGTREFAATCPECGKYFNDRGYLSSHMKIHRNRKEYGCEYCGKSFNQRVAYNMHVRIHTGEKPHVCQHCNKSFSRKMLLKQHLRIHTGEKPFTCVVCNKAFADRSNMTLHMRLHSGVKPYTCSVCNKSFTKKHHLKTHMNYHTGVKPYACAKCGLRFSQSSNMRTHFKKCSSTAYPPTTPVANNVPINMTVVPRPEDNGATLVQEKA